MKSKNALYFAARNGYQGFTSYFSEIFAPMNFTKIFILKGGPGTGKSTLMRKVHNALKEQCDSTETIACSSDPTSLDGIILKAGERRIAVLDGTSPHTTDPTLPVAVEEIVDLGCAIMEQHILQHKGSLAMLLEKKKLSYKLAYHFLLVCGEIDGNYRAVSNYWSTEPSKGELKDLFDAICFCRQGSKKTRLYNAFGKDGFVSLPYEFDDGAQTILIRENPPLMRSLYEFIVRQRKEFIAVPDVLSGRYNCLYLPSVQLAVVHEDVLLLSDEMQRIYDESLALSAQHFADASKHHFEMENIYHEALDFDMLNEISENLIEKIKVLFSIS